MRRRRHVQRSHVPGGTVRAAAARSAGPTRSRRPAPRHQWRRRARPRPRLRHATSPALRHLSVCRPKLTPPFPCPFPSQVLSRWGGCRSVPCGYGLVGNGPEHCIHVRGVRCGQVVRPWLHIGHRLVCGGLLVRGWRGPGALRCGHLLGRDGRLCSLDLCPLRRWLCVRRKCCVWRRSLPRRLLLRSRSRAGALPRGHVFVGAWRDEPVGLLLLPAGHLLRRRCRQLVHAVPEGQLLSWRRLAPGAMSCRLLRPRQWRQHGAHVLPMPDRHFRGIQWRRRLHLLRCRVLRCGRRLQQLH